MPGLTQHLADLAFLLARCQANSAPCWPGISAGKMPGWLSTLLTWHFCWQDARLTQHDADLAFLLARCQLTQHDADLSFLLARCQADSARCWPGISAGKMPGWLSATMTWHFCWQDARLVHHPAYLVLTAYRLTWCTANLVLPAARLTLSPLEYFSSSWPTDLYNSADLVLAATSPVGRMAWPSLKMAAMLQLFSTWGFSAWTFVWSLGEIALFNFFCSLEIMDT